MVQKQLSKSQRITYIASTCSRNMINKSIPCDRYTQFRQTIIVMYGFHPEKLIEDIGPNIINIMNTIRIQSLLLISAPLHIRSKSEQINSSSFATKIQLNFNFYAVMSDNELKTINTINC